MKDIVLANGKNLYDFFLIPTIRVNTNGAYSYLTFEWLWWYLGIKW
jgi:hypothetical protein